MLQKYERLYSYIEEYQSLIYDIYSKHVVSFLCDYYNFDEPKSIVEKVNILSGSYEVMGDLSGKKWKKFMLLPVYFPEEITTTFDGQETGYIKQTVSSCVIPDSYQITPYPGDLLRWQLTFLDQGKSTTQLMLYTVTGVEVTTNANRRFWKMRLSSEQSFTISDVEKQLSDIFVFYEYTKKIYTLEQATQLTNLMAKNKSVSEWLKIFYDPITGFYQAG